MKKSGTQGSTQQRRTAVNITPIAAACSALLFAAGAHAQQAADPVIPSVVVSGIRGSIESSIAAKKNAEGITEVVTAEDIGKLPDVSIAESLARLPGLAGQRVQFATATQWVARLSDAKRQGSLEAELRRLSFIPLLVVDEVGYIPFDPEAANLMFSLVSSRYERASMIVTSNKPFSAWGEIFGDEVTAVRIEIEATLPLVGGEETYVEQVVRNLLTNAAKYSADPALILIRAEYAGDEVIVRVLDEGIGLPETESARAFDLFYRSPNATRVAQGAEILGGVETVSHERARERGLEVGQRVGRLVHLTTRSSSRPETSRSPLHRSRERSRHGASGEWVLAYSPPCATRTRCGAGRAATSDAHRPCQSRGTT